jgi:hypothetical protein
VKIVKQPLTNLASGDSCASYSLDGAMLASLASISTKGCTIPSINFEFSELQDYRATYHGRNSASPPKGKKKPGQIRASRQAHKINS